jgi:hypothetical protein
VEKFVNGNIGPRSLNQSPFYYTDSQILAVVVIREKEKDLRSAQNKILKELDPLVVTFHLPSMKIFFTNVITEEVNVCNYTRSKPDQRKILK